MRIGLIGDTDSGKTTTARALAKMLGDTVTFVDTPAQEAQTWLNRNSNLDGLLLVVSVMDGPMPYTKTHLEWASKVGIRPIGVWLNKLDMYDRSPELLEVIEMETRDVLAACGLEDEQIPVGVGSSLKILDPGNDESWNKRLRDFWGEVCRYSKGF